MPSLLRALSALGGAHERARLADDLAARLRERLPADYVVLARYAPRDHSNDEVPLVVVGPHGVLVVEPREEDGDLVCYQDHWYRGGAARMSQALRDSPSNRARWNASRVKNDLASGGYIYTSVEAVVVFTNGNLTDARSSCVPVFSGIDELVQQLLLHAPTTKTTLERTRALVGALARPIYLVSA